MINIRLENLEDYLKKAYSAGWHGSLELKDDCVADLINEIKNQNSYYYSEDTIRISTDHSNNLVFTGPTYMDSVYSGNNLSVRNDIEENPAGVSIDVSNLNDTQQYLNFNDTSNLSLVIDDS